LFLASKDSKSSNSMRPYKNASNVFVHLVDDPMTRRKLDRNTGRNSSLTERNDNNAQDQDVLDRMMHEDRRAAQELASRELEPINLNGNESSRPIGQPSNAEAAKGKRAYKKDYMNVATGQMRLFGGDATSQAAPEQESKRDGKKIIQMPHQQPINIFK